MRFSLELPTTRVHDADQFVTAEALTEVTRAAAAAGFGAVYVTDHPAPDGRWLDGGGHHALDPFAALAVAAAADGHIGLQTHIYVAAYRNPFLGAKQVQTLQVLSGGRVLLGVAAGYLRPEFGALGVDFDQRGALLDDALEVLDAVFTGEDVARETDRYRARGVRLRPIPDAGRPPIWVGGNSRAAMRRAAAHDGWAPFHTGGFAKASRTAELERTEDLVAAIASLQRARADAGRHGPFDVCWSATWGATSSTDARLSEIAALARAGVTWLTVSLAGDDRSALLAQIEAFGRDVIAAA